jgi:hypothetical protein
MLISRPYVELKATRRRSWGERRRGEDDYGDDSGNDEAHPIADHDVRHVKNYVKWIVSENYVWNFSIPPSLPNSRQNVIKTLRIPAG